ncbi:cytochrome b-c1 complex subunit 6-like protein [Leptotrombidium deliense]|uniref:Cytochrome b-c1 complex subunit 6 n=1 Tax=Leptotrombidium deliense TaxID=299467 RepID=A0A443SC79_9ACAR|nr:cytochrome b-c1 complex subunit 6-like protein [Leptotrombidium deliense]
MDLYLNSFITSLRKYTQNSLKSKFVVKAEEEEEELVDPQEVLREDCTKKHCMKLKEKLEQCNNRVNSKKQTSESCFEEVIDLFHCVDHCVAETLFSKLK